MNCRFKKLTATFTGMAIMSSIFVGTIVPAQAAGIPNSVSVKAGSNALNSQESEVLEFENLINDFRAGYGLSPLKFNSFAAEEAAAWSKKMGTTGNYRHASSSEHYQPFKNLRSARMENIAMSPSVNVESMFNQWKNSASHRSAMLDPRADSFGIGFYKTSSNDPKHATSKMYGTTVFYKGFKDNLPGTYSNATNYYDGGNALIEVEDLTNVTPPSPTFNKSSGTYAIPSKTGVIYYNQATKKRLSAGSHEAYGSSTNIIAAAQPGYRIPSGNVTSSWGEKFVETNYKDSFNPSAPRFYNTSSNRSVYIPSSDVVDYYLNGKKVSSGTQSGFPDGTVKVEAKVKQSESDYYYLASYDEPWYSEYGTTETKAKMVTFDAKKATYTIPAAEGVVYQVNGEDKAAGTYRSSEGKSIDITVSAQSGYSIENAENFVESYTFPVYFINVSPKAPSFETNSWTYTIPATTGVTYKVNGAVATAGTHKAKGGTSVKITTVPNKGYKLQGASSWTQDYQLRPANAQSPTMNEKTGDYTIPSVAGLLYKVDGVTKSPGNYKTPLGTTVVITVEASDGYRVQGAVTTWNFKAIKIISIAPSTPTKNVTTGVYTIPNRTGVTYYVDGVLTRAGSYSSGYKNVTITAKANNGSSLSGVSSWHLKLAKINVTPQAPSFDQKGKKVTIPSTTGVKYFVDGVVKSAGTHSVSGSITVTAGASAANYNVSASKWTYDYRTKVAPVAPKSNFAKGTITIPSKSGVVYYINNVKKNAGNYTYSGSVTVTTKPSSSHYVLSGANSWKMSVSKAVTAAKPTFSPSKNTVYIPKRTGVVYYINNVKKNPGTYRYTSTGTVTAKASSSSYRFSGAKTWKFDNRNVVRPKAPYTNGSKNTVKIYSVKGVKYYINGKYKKPGTYRYTSTGAVTSKVTSSYYKTSGATSWKFDNRNGVRPKAPYTNGSKNTVKIYSVKGVKYYINGKYKKPGTYRYTSTGTVTSKATSSYYKTVGTKSWKFDNRNGVRPKAPSINKSKKTVKIYSKKGVKYYINGKYKKPGTYKYSSKGTVTSKASSSYYRTYGSTKWYFDNRVAARTTAPRFSPSKNTVKIYSKKGVKYYINGKYKKPGTYRYTSTGKVTAKASSSYYKTSGKTYWKFDNRNAVRPRTPAFNAPKDRYYIPSTKGVKYYVNGKYKPTGTYSYRGTVRVTAKASSSYYRTYGSTAWTKKL